MPGSLVDAERIVCAHLRANGVEAQVHTAMPHPPLLFPIILATASGGNALVNRPQPGWLYGYELTLQAYGLTKESAHDVISQAVAALGSLPGVHVEGPLRLGRVTAVTLGALGYDPDPELLDAEGHSRPRYTTTITVVAHP